MKSRIVILSLLLALGACGGESDTVGENTNKEAADKGSQTRTAATSKLNDYLSEERICDVLPVEKLKELFNAPDDVKKSPFNFRESYSCNYTWPHPDAAEREKNMVSAMMASMTGDGPKLSMRDRMTEYQVGISLKQSQRSADTFVPKKLSEEEIDRQIAAAKKRTDERLTAEQKELAGDMATSMVENMLRKNNENEEVSGVGDAAFWSKLGTGSLELLDGDVRVTVTPVIAATKEEDLATAKKIAEAVLD